MARNPRKNNFSNFYHIIVQGDEKKCNASKSKVAKLLNIERNKFSKLVKNI